MSPIINSIKTILKKNYITYTFFSFLYKTFFFCYQIIFNNILFWGGFYIRKLKLSKRYSKLKKQYYSKSGRCFIIATGPSLSLDDVKKLENEITFGMNSLIKWFPLMGWETTYYGIQDYNTYKSLKSDIELLKKSTIFYSLDGQAGFFKKNKIQFKKKNNSIEYPLYYGNHMFSSKLNTKFSSNSSLIVYDGYTIAYSLLQIAVYMGFKEIILLGADCNYNQKKKNIVDIGVHNSKYKILGDRMIFAYKIAKDYADSHEIKIYNATRGGNLEVFPRVNLDDVLKK